MITRPRTTALFAAFCAAVFSVASLGAGLVSGARLAAVASTMLRLDPRLVADPIIVMGEEALRAFAQLDPRLAADPIIVMSEE